VGRALNGSDLRPSDARSFVVRAAAPGDEEPISAVCSAGFTASSAGLLPSDEITRRVSRYYGVARVRSELRPSPPGWLGYAVAEVGDRVVGAAGGSAQAGVGHLLVLYLDLGHRGRGIGSALLRHVTASTTPRVRPGSACR
jgi:GNAT superfamily N-acetyltransferase